MLSALPAAETHARRVAGVIGRKRFLYDLWGDAVNTASRMESQGTPGRIQITRATYELLDDEFESEPRGTIVVKGKGKGKGKGKMEVWHVLGRRPSGATAARASRSIRSRPCPAVDEALLSAVNPERGSPRSP